ncbi:MAG: glutamate formimidoyltransferase, partial [Solirubrobacteraceae bacterium]
GAGDGVRLLDVHRDADHNRSVFTLAGGPATLAPALLSAARAALEHVSIPDHAGVHPRVGVLDVAPIVHLHDADRGAACAEALVLGEELGRDLGLPVLLYGALASGRTRADLRRGGPEALGARLASGELRADFGPSRLHPRGGAVLVGARPPLVAFNLELAPPARLEEAQQIAARVREGGAEGLPGVRAIGLELSSRRVAQVSFNVEDPTRVPLATLVEAVGRHAEIAAAELVGLAPEAALAGFPLDLPMPGFDPERHIIERALSH